MIRRHVLAMAAALCVLPSVAMAAGPHSGVYALAGLGRHEVAVTPVGMPAQMQDSKGRDNALAYSAGGGYRFGRYFAVEGNYYDMPDKVQHASLGKVGARVTTLSALALLPIGERVDLFARYGTGRMTLAVQPADASRARGSVSVRQLGIGGNVHLSPRSFVRGEWNAWGGVDGPRRGDAAPASARRYDLENTQFTVSYGYKF